MPHVVNGFLSVDPMRGCHGAALGMNHSEANRTTRVAKLDVQIFHHSQGRHHDGCARCT